MKSRKARTVKLRIDAGLLALRMTVALAVVLLLALTQSKPKLAFGSGAAAFLILLSLLTLMVLLGCQTRLIAGAVSVLWLWAAIGGLRLHQDPLELPARAAEFAIIFAALGLTGPGKYSLQGWLRTYQDK